MACRLVDLGALIRSEPTTPLLIGDEHPASEQRRRFEKPLFIQSIVSSSYHRNFTPHTFVLLRHRT